MNSRLVLRLAVAAAFILALVAFFALDVQHYLDLAVLREQRDALLAWTQDHLLLALCIYVGIYILMAALSVPGAAVLTLAGGALFGVLAGTLAVSFASSIGATLVFVAARFLFRDVVQKRFTKRLASINRGVERDGAFYLLALRLVPVFPFWVVNLVMALTPIRTWTYY